MITARGSAAVLAAVLAGLLGAGWWWGWRGVRTRQGELRRAPSIAAEQRRNELVRELHGRLDALISRARVARGEDELVLGSFEIDGDGRTSVLQLSDSAKLAGDRAFRDRVVRDLSRVLSPAASSESPPQWRTLPFAGVPALVAVGQVSTPKGMVARGFVVDRSALTRWLAERAGDMVAELHAGDRVGAPEIVPGWQLTVAPNPRALVRAAGEAAAHATTFVIRFIAIGSLAALLAVLVVVLVRRAERLAR